MQDYNWLLITPQLKAIYQDIKDAGFNVVTYTGACDYSIEENKRILEICEELDLKFLSSYQGSHTYSMV